ncbi:endonuclease/exonuclease/phosphatase family domain-containing protein 1-like [Amphibalanus amphitrite]|uniref:endonuclease/exonuclease/phosphatase family domain-containing protein 1-like n=1 Tax=Amphibalanus amphitrite TaxID=1232801 RepID=UPI001C929F81|nr:endonuclease/exonuclease/phosphatase family domain-containing protein 1-like [Amphibalanus amphitrite]
MGQKSSSPAMEQGGPERASTRSHHLRGSLRRRLRRKDISATFNMLGAGFRNAPLDVNTATEEQLAALPGLSAPLAANIVAHRAALGGFQQPEDLALVNGVGAARLHRIRAGLCVGRPNNRVPGTSQPVMESPEGRSGAASPQKINLNTATIFDLMQVQFISQETADRILQYRDKKGGFRSLRQLAKVRGVSRRSADVLRHYFTLDDASEHESSSSEKTSVTAPAEVGAAPPATGAAAPLGHRRTHSVPLGLGATGPYLEASGDICELLALHSPRPVLEEVFNSQRGGRPVFRLATWNLERLCADKAANPGVLEVVCRTILENGLGLVAVQEVFDADALGKICSELNTPSLHKVKNWQGWRGAWRWSVSPPSSDGHRCGFIYDVSKGVELRDQTLVPAAGVTAPYVGKFKVNKFYFSVITVRLRWPTEPPSTGNESNSERISAPLEAVEKALEQMLRAEDDILVMGDFSRAPDDSAFEVLRRHKFHPVVPEGVTTNVTGSPGDPAANRFSNIWMTEHTEAAFTGHYSVVRTGLSHLAIPHGWRWGGVVSAHCPVWCEMYSSPSGGGGSGGLSGVAALQAEYRRSEELHRREMAALSARPRPQVEVS